MGRMATDPLTAAADELYALTPDEFTAARNAKAKQATDRDLIAQIRQLRKPSPAAWVSNALVRFRSGQIDELLTLGASLREAQDDLDRNALATLSKQRRQLVAAMAREGGALAETLGHRVTSSVLDEVASTLHAAMADPDAATAMRTGRLVRSLSSIGFERVDLDGAVAVPGAPARSVRPAPPSLDRKAEREAAEREIRRAERDAEAARERAATAEAELDHIDRQIEEVERHRDELEGLLAELHERVAETQREIASGDRRSRSLVRDRDRAADAAERAARDAERARERLARLR
ncbi:MAG: hypothetical protein QOI70_1191 [Microbacteriaceae bacterium]|nr:hypothetical protein [Microbacteriaceae bacterium]